MRVSILVLAVLVPPAVAAKIAAKIAVALVLLSFELLEELHLQRRR